MENINFNISNEYEDKPVGIVKYANGEEYTAYSEESMLRAYKENWLVDVTTIKEYETYTNNGKTRHGLNYELIKSQYEELGLEYLKLDYMRDYVYNNQNRDNRDLDFELVR